MTMDTFCGSLRNHSGNQTSANREPLAVPDRPHRPSPARRRDISPANGRALEILGHAIEYLTDEYALSAGQAGALEIGDPRIEAVRILMTVNRQIYYACPQIEPAVRRIARWIFRAPAIPATDAQSKQPLS